MNKGQDPAYNLFPKWLVRSKVRPTRQGLATIERPQLITKLSSSINTIVSLIQAPAGYGKSTILANWRHHLLEKETNVAWLSIDIEDNNALHLFHYIAFAISEAGIDFSETDINTESFSGSLSLNHLIGTLVQAIESHRKKVVLVLDDFENLTAVTVNSVIEPLINYAPENLHIAIATRNDSNFKMANLELKGLAHRLAAEQLKFTLFDLENYLSDFMSQSDIKRVYSLTEGWPVAIQLIRSAVDTDNDIERIISSINSSNSKIADYLSEQIFENLNQEIQSFLMDISLVDRIDNNLADHLRDSQNSQALFNNIKNLNSLILPIDGVEFTYRLHPLFRQFLLDRLETNFPRRKKTLMLKMANWFADKGDLLKAVKYYIESDNQPLVEQLIANKGGLNLWLQEGLARLRSIVDLIDEGTMLQSPSLAMVRCIIHIKDGEVRLARKLYDQIAKISGVKPNSKLEPSNRSNFDLIAVRTLLHFYEGTQGHDQILHDLQNSLTSTPDNEHIMRGHFYTCLCGLNVDRGYFTEAEQYGLHAISEFEKAKSFYGKTYIYFHLGELLFAQGKTEQAKQQYDQGLAFKKRYFNDDTSIKFIANALVYELNYELNNLKSLPKDIEHLHKDLKGNEAWFNIYAAVYTSSINHIYQEQSLEHALQAIKLANSYADKHQLKRVTTILSCQKIDLLIRAGNLAEANVELEKSNLSLDAYHYTNNDYTGWRERDAVVQTITRFLIKNDHIQKAISELDYFIQQAKSYGYHKLCLKYHLLQVLAYAHCGDTKNMVHNVHQALIISEPSGLIRCFLNEGEDMKNSLLSYIKHYETQALDKEIMQHAQFIVESFTDSNESLIQQPEFIDREIQIIQQLTEGHANKVIARNIGISEHTVRYHLKKIFAKLKVNSRLKVVKAAREQHLI